MIRGWWLKLRCIFTEQRGNMAVEFGFIAPLLVLLFIGLVDYGLAARERSTLDAAVRAGLQVLLNNSSNAAAAQTIAEAIAPGAAVDAQLFCICSDGTDVACSGPCPIGAPRQIATVLATRDHSLLLPWPGFDDPISLSATARGRVK